MDRSILKEISFKWVDHSGGFVLSVQDKCNTRYIGLDGLKRDIDNAVVITSTGINLGTATISMTTPELQAYSGPQINLLTLLDVTGNKNLALYDRSDTTSPSSALVIIDAVGRRYKRQSVLTYLERIELAIQDLQIFKNSFLPQ